jgi:crotonobetainyl-CoA:carnitine CoA-transferase CaiB-like acyl-CoA transferase
MILDLVTRKGTIAMATSKHTSKTGSEAVFPGSGRRPLDGIRVLELGQLLAGPFTSTILGYFGAEVIKVEAPQGGDPIRTWREMDGDTSLWWHSLARNKKSVTLDLRTEKGRQLARRLALGCDVLVENFRPGTLEKWGLSPDELRKENPQLICARISGYGQTGPYAARPGYASVCEGFGGLRFVNGYPGERPVRPNLSLGDSLAGLHATLGVLLALLGRQGGERGQDVDIGIFEGVYNLMEAVVPEYDRNGVVRQPAGSTITGIVPTNTYLCRDKQYVIIGGNGDSIFKRLMRAAGRNDLADDRRLETNEGRVRHEEEIDRALATWTAGLDAAEVLRCLEDATVPAGPIYSVAQMMEDPQYQARGLFEEHEVGGRPLKIPALMPRLTETPGRTEWTGPALGAHNDEILRGLLGLSEEDMASLADEGVISS